MKQKSLKDIQDKYDLELDRVVNEIKKSKAKTVLLQFPDGLKPWANSVQDYLSENLGDKKIEFLIWFGDCWGACDVPVGLNELKPKVDLMIQFGHNELMPSY
ncbi:MAG: diphthamide synthesis protein [Candidatus Nanoarchaeia archaeon]